MSISVTPLIAETTIATSFHVRSCARVIAASSSIAATLPTDVPPNFMTKRDINFPLHNRYLLNSLLPLPSQPLHNCVYLSRHRVWHMELLDREVGIFEAMTSQHRDITCVARCPALLDQHAQAGDARRRGRLTENAFEPRQLLPGGDDLRIADAVDDAVRLIAR